MASLIVVVITGGGSGIGAGIARRIAREKNVFVVVADLDVNVFVFPFCYFEVCLRSHCRKAWLNKLQRKLEEQLFDAMSESRRT